MIVFGPFIKSIKIFFKATFMKFKEIHFFKKNTIFSMP